MNTIKTGVGLLLAVVLAIVLYNMAALAQAMTPPPTSPSSIMLSVARPVPSSSHRIVGPPTVTAAFIDRVLAHAHSPAVGLGTVMYTLGVKYGIDPVYPLAFFHHESGYGEQGMAATTHSIGNIRCTVGYSCDPSGGYRAYATYAASVEDWYLLMRNVYLPRGLDTVEKIIPVYAPNADHNNEGAYVASVNSDVARWRKGEF